MKLLIDNNITLDKNKTKILGEFCLFCAKELPITGEFEIIVTSNRPRHGITTTAAYSVGENKCAVYGKNRSLPDIMRSIAHEMTHMMQDQTGLLVGKIRDIGGFHEDQANARAGELLKQFVKNNSSRRIIYENIIKVL
jgi:hypothetical protein